MVNIGQNFAIIVCELVHTFQKIMLEKFGQRHLDIYIFSPLMNGLGLFGICLLISATNLAQFEGVLCKIQRFLLFFYFCTNFVLSIMVTSMLNECCKVENILGNKIDVIMMYS